MKQRFKNILDRVNKVKLLVIGDLILDEYIWGNATRISPEAPVPVIRVKSKTYSLGGAANVAHNLRKLGVSCIIAGIIGDDGYGRLFKDILLKEKIDCRGLLVDSERPTTLKTRIMAQGYQIARADYESDEDLKKELVSLFLDNIENCINNIDGIIISDYGKGVINELFMSQFMSLIKKRNIFVAVDPKEKNFSFYHDVNIITPNKKEASGGSGYIIKDRLSLIRAGKRLIEELNLEYLLITRSEEGMSFFDSKYVYHIPTLARTVYDVTGAGDTVISHFMAYLCSGGNPLDAAILSNIAAGIKVTKLGSAAVSNAEVEHYLEHEFSNIEPILESLNV